MYQKEAKSRYHRQYVREDYLLTQSPIFDLQKFHNLRPKGELVPNGPRSGLGGAAGAGGKYTKSPSQSLTNVLGF